MDEYTELAVLDPTTGQYVDFTQFLTERGMTVTASDIESNITTLDGTTNRGRIATKRKINAVCHALNSNDTSTVMKILSHEYVSVRYLDPEFGMSIRTMFVKERPAAFRKRRGNDVLWDGISFTLIER